MAEVRLNDQVVAPSAAQIAADASSPVSAVTA